MTGQRHQIGIIGTGKIGGSLAASWSEAEHDVRAFDTDPGRLHALSDRGWARPTTSLEDACDGADVVILAAPVQTIIDLLPPAAAATSPDTLILDTGSSKRHILSAMEATGVAERSVGGHPIAGNDRTAEDAWDANMFRGRTFVLIATAATGPRARDRAETLVRDCGASPFWTDADAHDRVIAATSHLPLLNALALSRTLSQYGDAELIRRLSGGQLRAALRMSDSPPAMLRDIIEGNRDNITAVQQQFVKSTREILGAADDELLELLRQAANRPGLTDPS